MPAIALSWPAGVGRWDLGGLTALGCTEVPRHPSQERKAQAEMWEGWNWFVGPQACNEAGPWGSQTHGGAENGGVRGKHRLGQSLVWG